MAPVLIKAVVRCSSEDSGNGKVENLLHSQVDPSAGRWTCSKHDTNQLLEAEFQLERSSFINHLDIGNYGSAFVEVFVGNSMWPPGKEFLSLLPSAMLMMPADCKQWRQTNSVRMFHEESFNKRALKEKWDCIRVICRQPYRKDKQFGLSFIRFGTKDQEVDTPKSPIQDKNSSSLNGSSSSTPKGKTFLTPRLKKSSIRNRGESPDSPGELTWASKVLQAALDTKSKRPSIKPFSRNKDDSILDDDDDNDNFRRHSNRKATYKRPSSEDIEIFDKKKGRLLESPEQDENFCFINEDIEDEVKCFLDGIDFTKIDLNKVTYSDLRGKMEEQRGRKLNKYEKKTFLKIARDAVARVMEDENDDDNGPETSQGSETNTRCPQQSQEEQRSLDLTAKRRPQPKKRMPSFIIDDEIFTDARLSPRKEASDAGSFTTVSSSFKNDQNTARSETEQFTECPICGELFSSLVVEEHAANCMNFAESASNNSSPLVECPICSREFSSESIVDHANYCVETSGRHEDPEAIIAL